MSDVLERMQNLIEIRNRKKSDNASRRQDAVKIGLSAYEGAADRAKEDERRKQERDQEAARLSFEGIENAADRALQRELNDANLANRIRVAGMGISGEQPPDFWEKFKQAVDGAVSAADPANKRYGEGKDYFSAFEDPEARNDMMLDFQTIIRNSGLTEEQVAAAMDIFERMFDSNGEEPPEEPEPRPPKDYATSPLLDAIIAAGGIGSYIEETGDFPTGRGITRDTVETPTPIVENASDIVSLLTRPIEKTRPNIARGAFEEQQNILSTLIQSLPNFISPEDKRKIENMYTQVEDGATVQEMKNLNSVLQLIVNKY